MKKATLILSGLVLALVLACRPNKDETLADTYLPTDVLSSCTVTESEFDAWFADGKATENGVVNPANSVDFVHDVNCDFYKWSQQMFLFLTSPAKGDYGDGGYVFESPVFYTVSPEDANGNRKLIPHKKGQLLSADFGLEKSFGLDSEEGQATGDALMAKDGSMVYYITMVNDVYAEFLEMVGSGRMKGNRFPTTQAALDSIKAYAGSQKRTLPDANALAMEIKTSWVDAATLADASDFVTIKAWVPTYTKTPTRWTISGRRQTTLALIGMHIVGSTAGHPEMVWSTFEHIRNAPNLSYAYIDKNNQVKTRKADTTTDWLLSDRAANLGDTVSHMKFKADSIYANFPGAPDGNTVSPSNTTRTKPWGVAENAVPNPEDATAAASNSKVISINNTVMGFLKGNDVRKHYLFIGSTWTPGGTGPTGTSFKAGASTKGVAIGTSQLANSTMETYAQNGIKPATYGSCFSCHSNNGSLAPDQISHVLNDLLPQSAKKMALSKTMKKQ